MARIEYTYPYPRIASAIRAETRALSATVASPTRAVVPLPTGRRLAALHRAEHGSSLPPSLLGASTG